LVHALQADLVGPFNLDEPSAVEELKLPPSRWYLTGFLAPAEARQEEEDPTDEEAQDNGVEHSDEEGDGDEGEAKLKKRLPSSIGVSVLLPASATQITAVITYADYTKESRRPDPNKKPVPYWARQHRAAREVIVPLTDGGLEEIAIPGTGGLVLAGKIGAHASRKPAARNQGALALRREPSAGGGECAPARRAIRLSSGARTALCGRFHCARQSAR